jgi:hypothetical protein
MATAIARLGDLIAMQRHCSVTALCTTNDLRIRWRIAATTHHVNPARAS